MNQSRKISLINSPKYSISLARLSGLLLGMA
jgi:hypothetical protein